MKRFLLAMLGMGVLAVQPALAQEATQPAGEKPEEEEPLVFTDTVVVSASKTETTIINAPATMSVVTGEELQHLPSQNFADVLRAVPGVNVIQMSARDVNLASRQATATLETAQLVLLDGRTMYLDFFGLVLWDLVPTNPSEIKQIEVVRGPASAVWGANARSGVVNIITRSPREAAGNYLNLTGGMLNRDEGSRSDDGTGGVFGGNLSIARAPNERFSYRLAGGYFYSDPYSRPVGQIPVIPDPRIPSANCRVVTNNGVQQGLPIDPTRPAECVGGAFYPDDTQGSPGQNAFENDGTKQPKVDLRIDNDMESGARLALSGGYAGTQGIVHTGIGPFQLQSGSYLAYGRVAYSKNAFRAAAFGNFLDAEAPNLLAIDPAALPRFEPIQLNFSTQTYDLELGNTNLLGSRNILTYGGNVRRNNFTITLAPNAENRTEVGGYIQDEFYTDKFRLSVGARVDKYGNLSDPVFSPRVSVLVKPAKDHSFRLSYNRAFRSPSAINNFLDQDIFLGTVDLRPLVPLAPPALRPSLSAPFTLRIRAAGSEEVTPPYDLKEESVDAYEVAYTGNLGRRTTFAVAAYQNDTNDNINFTILTPNASYPQGLPGFDIYTSANAPAIIGINANGIPVPGATVAFLEQVNQFLPPARRIFLPHTAASYLNLGPLRQRGVEVSLDHRLTDNLTFSANYSWQDEPKPLDPASGQIPYLSSEIALAPTNRMNGSLSWNSERFVGSAQVNYQDEAFWADVLTSPYFGFTDAFTMVNASFGVKWADGKVVTALKGTNLFNERIQQHVFGDLIPRTVSLDLRVKF